MPTADAAPTGPMPTAAANERAQVDPILRQARDRLSSGDLKDAAGLLSTIRTSDPALVSQISDARSVIAFAASQLERQHELDDVVCRAVERAESELQAGSLDAADAALLEALSYAPTDLRALTLQQQIRAKTQQVASEAASVIDAPSGTGHPLLSHETVIAPNATFGGHGTVSTPAIRLEEALPVESTIVFAGRSGAGTSQDRPALEARLVVIQSPDPRLASRSFDLEPLPFSIGRATESSVSSHDMRWSRRHAVIELKNRALFVRDCGSANGVFVDGRRVPSETAEPLFFGAQIAIGGTTFRLVPAQETSLPDLTGIEIAGRYVLESLLRESAQGALYVATLRTLPRRVAVKLLSPELLRYPGYRERFKHRAEVTAQLQHPHICRVMDHGEVSVRDARGRVIETEYLCLDLMSGGSLTDLLEGATPVPLTSVEKWVQLIAEALGYAHAMGVVHGDLKPSAIVFDEEGNPYVTDFALGQSRTTDLIGTPAYMAPEQWAAGAIGPSTDQFSLAVLAYYMIAGVRPFEGQDHPDMRRRNFSRGPIPVHEEARTRREEAVDPEISVVIARGLAIEPDRRYSSITEFAADLGRALRGIRRSAAAERAPRVFFSYRRGPAAGWAVHIASQLRERHGVDVFLDVQGVDSAAKFPDRLERAIDRADVFVCLLGPTTLESAWVRQEIRLAHDKRKPMIPIFQENYQVPEGKEISAPSLQALFEYDGVRLLDEQNLYVESLVLQLADRIKNTFGRG